MRKWTAKRYGTYLAITAAEVLFFTGCGKAGGDGQTGMEAVSVESQTLAGGIQAGTGSEETVADSGNDGEQTEQELEEVTDVKAGEVYYSEPNRIVLFYHEAQIQGQYTRVGYFDSTEDFVSAVEDNPVLESWGNKIVVIREGR